MKIHLVALAIVLATTVHANVLISEVLPNPDGSDSGKEFIELYNNADTNIDLAGWSIDFSSKPAIVLNNTQIKARSFVLIGDVGWEDSITADVIQNIQLNNNNYGIQLIDTSNNIVDALGWGNVADASFFETNTVSNPSSGKSLTRSLSCTLMTDTDDNKEDFISADPHPTNSQTPAQCTVSCTSNSDCDDDNDQTVDTCNNPGSIDSYCSYVTKTQDSDNDGVENAMDRCENTNLPESLPKRRLHRNRVADIDGDGIFETKNPRKKLKHSSYNISQTHGCSCEQILEMMPGKQWSEQLYGCKKRTLDTFMYFAEWMCKV